MAAPLHPHTDDIQKRISSLKFRISKKKIEANIFLSDIVTENTSEVRIKGVLEIIRNVLEKQQSQDGNVDNQKIQ